MDVVRERVVRHWLALLAAAVVVVAVWSSHAAGQLPTTMTRTELAATGTALARLPVRDAASRDGYDRTRFGDAWSDSADVAGGGNGCDTRDDVLARDLAGVVREPGDRCVVRSGLLADPYTGARIAFRRGRGSSGAVQIDHVVALSAAWRTGAQGLSAAQRLALANDPRNLLAVDGPTNQRKGDGDAADWLPPNRGVRCRYVARQVAVKAAYGLWVTRAEHDAMAAVLRRCVPRD